MWVNEEQIWDKKAVGRFPEEKEILDQVAKLLPKA